MGLYVNELNGVIFTQAAAEGGGSSSITADFFRQAMAAAGTLPSTSSNTQQPRPVSEVYNTITNSAVNKTLILVFTYIYFLQHNPRLLFLLKTCLRKCEIECRRVKFF